MRHFTMRAAMLAGLLMVSPALAEEALECTPDQGVRVQLEAHVNVSEQRVLDSVRVSGMTCTDLSEEVGYHVLNIDKPFSTKDDARAFVTGIRDIARRCEAIGMSPETCSATFARILTLTIMRRDAFAFVNKAPLHSDQGQGTRVRLEAETSGRAAAAAGAQQ